jgi:hypothetical protein
MLDVRFRLIICMVSGIMLAMLAGCAFSPDPRSVTQPGMEASHPPPFEGDLRKRDGSWRLTYVEQGNLAFGTLDPDKMPGGLQQALTDIPALHGQPGWYPRNEALVNQLADGTPAWEDFAAVMENVKKKQANSVADYNERLASVVADFHELQQRATNTELPEARDWPGEARRIASDHGKNLAKRLEEELTIAWVDETGQGLLEHVSPEPPANPVRIRVEYQGDFPDFTNPASPEAILDWLPAGHLAELETRAEQARARMENLAQTHASAKAENQRKLRAFRQQLATSDFSVSLETEPLDPTGYRATVEAPELVRDNGSLALAGPARIQVQAINLGAYLRLMGVMPPGTTLRTGPDADARAIRKVSGPEIGYAVETRGDWTRLFDPENQPLGWVPTAEVADPQDVIDARVERALGDR